MSDLEDMKTVEQYENCSLGRIYRKLKQYSFEDKVKYCFDNALDITDVLKVNIKRDNQIFPWELEYLAEISMLSPEGKHCKPINDFELAELVTIIRNYQHSHFKDNAQSILDDYVMAVGPSQFKVQEDIYHRLFRYWFFFCYKDNTLNVEEGFIKKYGCNYYGFMSLAILVRFYLTREILERARSRSFNIWNHIISQFPAEIAQLSMTRHQYIEQQTEKNKGILENGLYGLNYLHAFPFIDYKDRKYFPIPYLIVDAVTDSLLTRLTFNNEVLRTKIGKQTAEIYLTFLLRAENVYDEVFQERLYKKGKNKICSPDVMIRKGEHICLFDSKMVTPSIELRSFNPEQIEGLIARYAKYIKQMYERISDFSIYNPFEKSIDYSPNNIFGVVTVFEDSYIKREKIYTKVLRLLNIEGDSDEANFIRSHILILSLSEIERKAIYLDDIIPSIVKRRDDRSKWNNYFLDDAVDNGKDGKARNPAFKEMMDQTRTLIESVTNDLISHGIIDA